VSHGFDGIHEDVEEHLLKLGRARPGDGKVRLQILNRLSLACLIWGSMSWMVFSMTSLILVSMNPGLPGGQS